MSVFLALALSASSIPVDATSLQAMHKYGACVVAASPRRAEQILAMDYRSKAYREQMRDFAQYHDRCIAPNWRMHFSQMLFAGAVAEALLASQAKTAELPQILAYDPSRAKMDARSESEAMALCTAMQAPDATAELLGTEPATEPEIAAVAKVEAVLPNCLKKDSKLSLNPPALRALLALAAWRIVETPKVSAR